MSEEGEGQKQNTVLDKVSAAAFNMEAAKYRGDIETVDKAEKSFLKNVDLARSFKISEIEISKADTLGKLKAAIEEGKEQEEKFYRQSLQDLDVDPEGW